MNCTSGFTRCGCDECWARDPEVVADHLDRCFRDQPLGEQGWGGLRQSWAEAERYIEQIEDLWIWGSSNPAAEEKEIRWRLLAASASLLNLSAAIEGIRRGTR